MFDVAIVGLGPAGVTGAIYAARKQLSVVTIADQPGGEVINSGDIENWPGDGETDGITLAQKMLEHVNFHSEAVKQVMGKVATVEKTDAGFVLTPESGDTIEAKTVIYAAGRHPRELGVPGEKEMKNKGVTYCATCDAPLFKDKEVAVIGGGNTGAEAVIMLQKIAKKIYFLHIEDKLPADPILVKNFENDEKVEIILNAKTTGITGDGMVSGLEYEIMGDPAKSPAGDRGAGAKSLDVQGVFVTIGAVPNTDPVKDLVALSEFGAVVADRYGATNVEGFFAAGDVTDIRDAQIVVAAGHGCSAALSAGDFLSRQA